MLKDVTLAKDGKPAVVRYGAAVLAVAVVAALRLALDSYLGDRLVIPFFLLAAAWTFMVGGFPPALLCLALGYVVVDWLFVSPHGQSSLLHWDAQNVVAAVTYFAIGVGLTYLAHRFRMEKDRAEENAALARERGEYYRTTLASIGDGVITVEAEGRVTSLNPIAQRLTGWTESEALGRKFAEVFVIVDERTGRPAVDPVAKVFETGAAVAMADHTLLIARDGVRRPIRDNAAPIGDQPGKPGGVVVVFRDATEEHRAQMVGETLAAIVRSSEDAIIGKDLAGIIRNWNPAAERLFGYSAEEAIGQSIGLIVPPEVGEQSDAIMSRLRRGERVDPFESIRMRKDGSRVHASLAISPIVSAEGQLLGFSMIARDVSERRSSEEALRANEERLRLALNAGSVGAWDWEIPENRVTWSERVFAIHGVDPADFGNRLEDFQRLIHPDDAAGVQTALDRAIGQHEPYEVEFRIIRPNGETRWLSTRGHVFYDEQGRPDRMLGATIDATDRKRAEETLRFFAETSEALSAIVDYEATLQRVARHAVPFFCDFCVVYLLSESGQIARVAAAHTDPVKERVLDDMHSRYPLDWTSRSPILRALQDRSPQLVEEIRSTELERASRDDDHLRLLREIDPLSYVCVPLLVRDKVLGCLVCGTSQSGRRYGTEDLRVAEELARRAATAIDNARLYQEVKESARKNDDFIAMLAHELRNPLAAIQYANQLAMMPNAMSSRESSEIIARQVTNLVRLIDELLDVSRINRNQIQLKTEHVDAAAIVRRAVSTVRSLIDQRAHRIVEDVEENQLPVVADPVRLEQILVNLLSNAAKYTPDQGLIRISAQRERDEAVFRVRDNGIGIDKPLLDRVFDAFMQADGSLDRSSGGLGVGPSMVQKLVELHGGTVLAASEGLGKGAEFVVRLRLAEEAARKSSASFKTASSRRLRILAVDDNADMACTLGILLSAAGHEVQLAGDGLEALSVAEQQQPEVFLLDIGLPGMNGYDLARELRGTGFPTALFVAISGYGQPEDRERSKEAGFDFHLVKPVRHQELLAVLENANVPRRFDPVQNEAAST